jgi:hypothetical protein
VEGAAPNHALTEYYMEVFQIELTLDGYLFLQQKIKSDERLTWFSIDEVVCGETTDGKIAYLKALYDDFANDKSALKSALMALPDSFTSGYLFQPLKYGLTLLTDHQKPIYAGVLGKEKALGVTLTDRQLGILLGLASHLRGFEFTDVEEAIIFHPFGWVEVKDNPALLSELISLASLLKGTDLIIENHRDFLFRLSITPRDVYFDESLFSFAVKEAGLKNFHSKIPVVIHRNPFDTAFGRVKEKTEEFMLTLEFVHKLRSLAENQFSAENDDAQKIEDNYKKGLRIEPKFLALGLRGLIRREAGMIKFVVPYAIT